MSAGLRWVSCSRDLSAAMGPYRHLARKGALNTVCGGSASDPGIWRANSAKPPCKTCQAWADAHTESEASMSTSTVTETRDLGRVVEVEEMADGLGKTEPEYLWVTIEVALGSSLTPGDLVAIVRGETR